MSKDPMIQIGPPQCGAFRDVSISP
ncbi:hypothetical protein AZE42_12815 [Rhizopogon vesiculosus]|uniref:Uncharacterized protein n=1 Tax=Rhizopogon vesiculosus TaxID=180088 RepID=A0A1J8PSQ1_9AGAM|nr:hypothetical protein AZE42_12815 [Rhizopogon vesiculosus]